MSIQFLTDSKRMRKVWIFLAIIITLSIGCNNEAEQSADRILPTSDELLAFDEGVASESDATESGFDDSMQLASVEHAVAAKIEIESTEHNFGFLDSHDPCEYRFLVKNVGTAPLYLERGHTSCKCTMSTLPDEPIPPGMGAAIVVSSKIEGKDGPFAHTANIYTNDPAHKILTLKIYGIVQAVMDSYPKTVVFPARQFKEESTSEVMVYSQTWENFEIEKIEASDDTITWQVEPAPEQSLKAVDAKSGYIMNLTASADIPSGPFFKKLHVTTARKPSLDDVSKQSEEDSDDVEKAEVLHVSGTTEEEVRQLNIGVNGEASGRISLSGRNFFANDRFRLGIRQAGKEYKDMLILKVNDEFREIKATKIDVNPDFLNVSLTRMGKENQGLYRIDVTIPADAPVGDYWHPSGEKNIRITIDHPYIKQIDFYTDFTIIP